MNSPNTLLPQKIFQSFILPYIRMTYVYKSKGKNMEYFNFKMGELEKNFDSRLIGGFKYTNILNSCFFLNLSLFVYSVTQ